MTGGAASDNFGRHRPGPRAARIAEMLRVDHAGEFGAVEIYRGQRAIFEHIASKSATADRIRDMQDGEAAHLEAFNALLRQHRARPTLLAPIWRVAGYGLGAATALMGEKVAMACTAAVEDVIEQHYAAQAAELGDANPELAARLSAFRDDELAHKETAERHGAREAPGYGALSAAIKLGCRLAIKLSEKI